MLSSRFDPFFLLNQIIQPRGCIDIAIDMDRLAIDSNIRILRRLPARYHLLFSPTHIYTYTYTYTYI